MIYEMYPLIANKIKVEENKTIFRLPDDSRKNAIALVVAKRPVWEGIIETFRRISKVTKVRDLAATCPQHVYQASLSSSQDNGINIIISEVVGLYGFYFCDYKQSARISGIKDDMQISKGLSYFPYSKQQLNLSLDAQKIVAKAFPELTRFDNTYAMIQVTNYNHESKLFEESNLFPTVLSDYLPGLF